MSCHSDREKITLAFPALSRERRTFVCISSDFSFFYYLFYAFELSLVSFVVDDFPHIHFMVSYSIIINYYIAKKDCLLNIAVLLLYIPPARVDILSNNLTNYHLPHTAQPSDTLFLFHINPYRRYLISRRQQTIAWRIIQISLLSLPLLSSKHIPIP